LIAESPLRDEIRMGACQALRQALQSGGLVAGLFCAEIKTIGDEINELVNLPMYWELEARTVEK
jgi:hypothetical protein